MLQREQPEDYQYNFPPFKDCWMGIALYLGISIGVCFLSYHNGIKEGIKRQKSLCTRNIQQSYITGYTDGSQDVAENLKKRKSKEIYGN